MKQIFGYWGHFLRAHTSSRHVLVLGAFLVASIAINYGFGVDDAVMSLRGRGLVHTSACFVYYAVPFYFALLTYAWCHGKPEILRNGRYWLGSVLGILVYALYAGDHGVGWVQSLAPPESRQLVGRSAANLIPAAGGLVALALTWRTLDREDRSFYGLLSPRLRLRPYFGFVLLGLPFVVLASMHPTFLAVYPRFPSSPALAAHGLGAWPALIAFELCYGLAFVFVEVFFRGYLVVGLSRHVGPAAVMPAVAMYTFIHFGKPPAEALASVVGGWALAVVAWRTRSVRGGIVFHLGIAYALELAAWLQATLRSE